MSNFNLKLHITYYNKGFFNVRVDYDRYVRSNGGLVRLKLGKNGKEIEGKINRQANPNGTARIFGGIELRDWFQDNFKLLDIVTVDLGSFDCIILDHP